jgi:hypothetical protein
MDVGSGETIALHTSFKPLRIPFVYRRARLPILRGRAVARFMNRAHQVLSGKVGFRSEGRLTGFRGARNIVRTRTKYPAATGATVPAPGDRAANPAFAKVSACRPMHP